MAEPKPEGADSLSEKNVKAPNLIRRAKEEVEAIMHTKRSHHHHKETHGKSDDIDENTPISEIKGPSVLQRAKEEIEAIVQSVHTKKESDHHGPTPTSKKEGGGFWASIGRSLENCCSPFNKKTD